MPNHSSKKRSKDINTLATEIIEEAKVENIEKNLVEDKSQDESQDVEKNPHAQALGRLGGLKGGRARAAKLTADRRKEIAQNAAKARWKKKEEE